MNKIRGLILAIIFASATMAFAKSVVITKDQSGNAVTTITQDPTESVAQILAYKEQLNILTIRRQAFLEESARAQRDSADADSQIQDLTKQIADLEATQK